jgi:hypothetical protein
MDTPTTDMETEVYPPDSGGEKKNHIAGAENSDIPGANKSDIGRPDNTVKKMLRYAKAGQADSLKSLCDKQSPTDAQSLCGGNQELISKLAGAQLSADPINVKGETATVPLVFEKGEKEMVRLTLRGGEWYVVRLETFKLNNQ